MVKACKYCNRAVKYNARKNVHINIWNIPVIHFFCNQECKNKWIYEIQKLDKQR